MAIVDGQIRCSRCRVAKPAGDYSPSVVDKGCGECRACGRARSLEYSRTGLAKEKNARWRERNRPQVNALALERYHKDKRRFENTRLKTRYGITLAEFENLSNAQQGKCACCGDVPSRLVVDHCHVSGNVRGLLCGSCNTGIGSLGDDTAGVRGALAYLDRSAGQVVVVDRQIPDSGFPFEVFL